MSDGAGQEVGDDSTERFAFPIPDPLDLFQDGTVDFQGCPGHDVSMLCETRRWPSDVIGGIVGRSFWLSRGRSRAGFLVFPASVPPAKTSRDADPTLGQAGTHVLR